MRAFVIAAVVVVASASAPITDPCKKIECGALTCPGGSKLAEVPGHCCPYCDSTVVIPDTKDYTKDAKEAFKSYKTAKYAGGTGFVQTPDITDPCGKIECGNLVCPGGSKLAETPGHCCPYCDSTVVIPDTKDYTKDAKDAFKSYKTAKYAGGTGLLQKSPSITDPCGKIECGNLVCPGGSKLAETPGHCCPYCDSTVVIPDTKDYTKDAKEAFKSYKTAKYAGGTGLLQKSPSITDPCGKIECGNLVCPGGSKLAEMPGHCCPYCDSTVVIPDTKNYAADAKKAFMDYKTAKYAGGSGSQ